ncbi:SDR family NAD(P)-dependent oxidoreductase [Amycolatopsis sp. GM8]|uniref:SDR family NAD(P)-dependent oxidoreductase n=1 Tax=Amycolatopsis sp. GM8 TaxID=2896530 RepID=UPI001F2A5C88|nr:SDR family oxidoreductase [Amycolatopsis sp. GM8]
MFGRTLEGKVALVTGSTSGVGRATALTFAQEGAAVVVINGRDEISGKAVCADLAAQAPDAEIHFVRADMNSRADIAALFARTAEIGGGLDVFVHSGYGGSGNGKPDLFENMDLDELEGVISSVFTSLVRCCHHAVPLLKARGGGSILGVISDAAKVPTPGESVHGGALGGSGMFLRGLAREVGRYGIRVNAACPSLIRDTRNYDKVMADGFSRKLFEKIEKRATLGLPGPDDLANLITFLSGPLAAHITGQLVSINGGISGA